MKRLMAMLALSSTTLMAPAIVEPAVSAAPATTPTAAARSCTPLTNSGHCYEPSELCRNSEHGTTSAAGNGEAIECEDNNGWRWEPVR